MDLTLRFRRSLARRLLAIAGAATLAPSLVSAAGCGGNVVVDHQGDGTGGAGGAGGASSSSAGPGTTTAVSGTGPSTTAVSSAESSVVSSGTGSTVECIDWPVDAPCPEGDQALLELQQDDCLETDQYTYQVVGGPYQGDNQCCYDVLTDYCGVGRPFLVEDRPRASAPRAGGGGGWLEDGARPRTDALTAAQREALAAAWARDGLLEHASVAAFARFSLDLLAVGAPADLVEAAHRAALDEVRHARRCLALASAYGGGPIEPAPFPLDGAALGGADLAALAASTAKEGCVGEALAAVIAAEQLARATDPAVRAALAVIAEDEARHAELAFRTVAWAIRAGGEAVRAAVAAVFEDAARWAPRPGGLPDPDGALAGHGRLDAAAAAGAVARGMADVVLPCARALLDGAEARALA